MSLGADLENEVKEIFRDGWSIRDGTVVPSYESVGLGNDGVRIDATFLYAELADSTVLVDTRTDTFAAEVYKTFLRCAARIIRSEGAAITAYDGDRVNGRLHRRFQELDGGPRRAQDRGAVKKIIQPAIRAQYVGTTFVLKHVVGIDASEILMARTGIRGANDLVWVGRAANRAAKLSSLDDGCPTWITKAVYDRLNERRKVSGGIDMWEKRLWTAMENVVIYRSGFWWAS